MKDKDGHPSDIYSYALKGTESLIGQCLGEKGLNALLAHVQNAVIERGLVTTRAVVGPQNLKSGVFEIMVVEGRLASVKGGKTTPERFPWRSALAERPGDLVNQRDLEQALEVFKTLPTADVTFQIVPGKKAGESDLVVDWKQDKVWRVAGQVDDSGIRQTGRILATTTGYLENLLGLNELFYASYTHDLEGTSKLGLEGGTAHLSIPYEYWQIAADASTSKYHQSVPGAFQSYDYSGDMSNVSVVVSNVIHRDQTSRTLISAGIWGRETSNFIDGTQIDVQKRRTAGWLLEAKHKQYLGSATFEATVTATQAQDWFDALPAPEDQFGEGASRPRLLKFELDSSLPITLGPLRFTYDNVFRAQWTHQPLTLPDRFSIGGRYTVRGFDGESTLAGEKGLIDRNTLSLAIADTGQSLYGGIDFGTVYGPSTRWLSGSTLAGAVGGLKGKFGPVEYDVFIGTPLNQPAGFNAPSITPGFLVKAAY